MTAPWNYTVWDFNKQALIGVMFAGMALGALLVGGVSADVMWCNLTETVLIVLIVCGTVAGVALILATTHLIIQTDKAKG